MARVVEAPITRQNGCSLVGLHVPREVWLPTMLDVIMPRPFFAHYVVTDSFGYHLTGDIQERLKIIMALGEHMARRRDYPVSFWAGSKTVWKKGSP
jgi:hypothetical protein